jgi:peptidyl-prolyl cis-trans isomerase D
MVMNYMRDKKFMHFILWTVLAVFLVGGVFFTFGMRYLNTQNDQAIYAAKVGDVGITNEDFNRAYQPASERLYRTNENPTHEEIQALKKQVLDSLIDDSILEQTARKLGIGITDEELIAAIQHEPYFLDQNGKFSQERLNQILQANRMSPQDFEAMERQAKLQEKIRSALLEGVLYSPEDIQAYAGFLNRDLKADYVSIDFKSFEKKISPSEADLNDYYEGKRSQYDHPERAEARHIFIAAQSENPVDQDKAQKILEDYRTQILSGKAKFPDLARKFSQDSSSRDKGGEIGWIRRGDLPKDLEEIVFRLKKGEIAKPFKLQNGYDLVQLEDFEKAYKSTFQEVRSKVLKQYQAEKASDQVASLSEKLAEKLRQKESLSKAAADLGLPSSFTSWFNREKGIPLLKNSTAIADQLAGLYLNDWKGPIPLGESEYFFQITAAKNGETAERPAPNDDPKVVQRLMYAKQDAWLKAFLENQKKKLTIKTFVNG